MIISCDTFTGSDPTTRDGYLMLYTVVVENVDGKSVGLGWRENVIIG